MRSNFIILLIIISILAGCKNEEKSAPQLKIDNSPQPAPQVVVGCRGCHDDIFPDKAHSFACITCHEGDNATADKQLAHQGLIPSPAHPDNMQASCGKCHSQQLKATESDVHWTLTGMVNQTRTHFGAAEELSSLTEVPKHTTITTQVELADDMLRRRCLRCHLYSQGDAYPYVSRGTGCAACHMKFNNGNLEGHAFTKPTDQQCLSCHYGNYVGSDFHGKYEADYNWEYRTPYVTRQEYMRPYGVEQYNLSSDIHHRKGLTCIDCHSASGHGSKEALQCVTCHQVSKEQPLPESVLLSNENGEIYLTGKTDGTRHKVPQLSHPAHSRFGKLVECQVCHGQWSYNDSTSHLLRTELDDYDMWERLTVQGSHEVEMLLEHNLYSDDDELPPSMKDGITGTLRPGLWLKGFTQRRWEQMIVQKDSDGIIKVFRPILDIRLSMITEDEEVPFDNAQGAGSGLLPYTPHTTGPAGVFYTDRFLHLLKNTKPSPTN